MNRLGTGLLWSGFVVLAGLMVYTVAFDPSRGDGRPAPPALGPVAEVAVFYPESILWQELRQAVEVCRRRGLIQDVQEADTSILVRTPRYGRAIRFRLHDVRGLRETRDEVERVMTEAPPVAFIGSSNTVLTEAIADALRSATSAAPGKGPVMLIPWASAVLSEHGEQGEAPLALLGIYPGRMFRFCLNNQYQADLLTRCLAELDGGRPPVRVVIVEDRFDPYSVDLSSSFHRAVQKFAPTAEISEPSDAVVSPVLRGRASASNREEETLAAAVCRDSGPTPSGRTWVFLPLQEEPAERVLMALRRHQSAHSGESPLRVVCGDAIGSRTLALLAGHCVFPVLCVSSSSVRAPGEGISTDVQIPAEMVSALSTTLDLPQGRTADAEALRAGLTRLELTADDPSAIGRSLAFSRSGERTGDDLGHVLLILPNRAEVLSMTEGPRGRWTRPEALSGPPRPARP